MEKGRSFPLFGLFMSHMCCVCLRLQEVMTENKLIRQSQQLSLVPSLAFQINSRVTSSEKGKLRENFLHLTLIKTAPTFFLDEEKMASETFGTMRLMARFLGGKIQKYKILHLLHSKSSDDKFKPLGNSILLYFFFTIFNQSFHSFLWVTSL